MKSAAAAAEPLLTGDPVDSKPPVVRVIAAKVARATRAAAARDAAEEVEPALKVRHLAGGEVHEEAARIRHLAGTLTASELGAVWRSKSGRMEEYRVGQLLALLIGGAK